MEKIPKKLGNSLAKILKKGYYKYNKWIANPQSKKGEIKNV